MSKHAFWQALVFTAIVFFLGMILGFFFESKQSEDIRSHLVDSELNIIDEQLRQRIITDSNVSCSLAKESLFLFADKIYDEAIELEDADATGRLEDLTLLHKRYDLLRALLLFEAQQLKERCNDDFHIINYLYLYNLDDVEISSKQNYFSRQILDLKENHPSELIIIPIAVDTNLASVDVFVRFMGINSYPTMIIDGSRQVNEIISLEELDKIVFGEGLNTTLSSP